MLTFGKKLGSCRRFILPKLSKHTNTQWSFCVENQDNHVPNSSVSTQTVHIHGVCKQLCVGVTTCYFVSHCRNESPTDSMRWVLQGHSTKEHLCATRLKPQGWLDSRRASQDYCDSAQSHAGPRKGLRRVHCTRRCSENPYLGIWIHQPHHLPS